MSHLNKAASDTTRRNHLHHPRLRQKPTPKPSHKPPHHQHPCQQTACQHRRSQHRHQLPKTSAWNRKHSEGRGSLTPPRTNGRGETAPYPHQHPPKHQRSPHMKNTRIWPSTRRPPPLQSASAVVVHALCTRYERALLCRWLVEGNKGLTITGSRWLLNEERRSGKTHSSLALYLAYPTTYPNQELRWGRKWLCTTGYDWEK